MAVVLAVVARAPPSSMPLFLKTCGERKKEEGPYVCSFVRDGSVVEMRDDE